MKRKFKRALIIILILILLIIIGSYAWTTYKNESDNKEFKEVLKNASDIENVTDKTYYDIHKIGSITADDYIQIENSISENTSKEINMLKQFRDKTFNQTQKEYINIEINRLEKEELHHKKAADVGSQYKRYLNGEITAKHYIDIREISNNDTKITEHDLGVIKDEAITYIKNHPELKQTLEEINIDEDFYTNEMGGTGGSGQLYFKK